MSVVTFDIDDLKQQRAYDVLLVGRDRSALMTFTFAPPSRWTDLVGNGWVEFGGEPMCYYRPLPTEDLNNMPSHRQIIMALRASYEQGTSEADCPTMPSAWNDDFRKFVLLHLLDLILGTACQC